MFQSSFELMGYITITVYMMMCHHGIVSKLFRAYGLYNGVNDDAGKGYLWFQSSFELMGYITLKECIEGETDYWFQSSFELMGYITVMGIFVLFYFIMFQSSFELMGYITQKLSSEQPVTSLVSKLFRAYGLYNCFFSLL